MKNLKISAMRMLSALHIALVLLCCFYVEMTEAKGRYSGSRSRYSSSRSRYSRYSRYGGSYHYYYYYYGGGGGHPGGSFVGFCILFCCIACAVCILACTGACKNVGHHSYSGSHSSGSVTVVEHHTETVEHHDN